MSEDIKNPETVETVETVSEVSEKEPKKKNKKKKWIIAGVVVVVLAVVVAAGLVWHEQPTFCNAICHSPMDKYVETYYSGDEAMLVTSHANADVTCLSCHIPTISQQVSEAMGWISGNYEFDSATGYLALRRTTETLSATGTGSDFCLNENCHQIAELEAATGDWERDPHSATAHSGSYLEDCSNCHRVHGTSVLVCASCHSDAVSELPDGWVAPDDDTDERDTFTAE